MLDFSAMKFVLPLLLLSFAASAQTMFRCTDPDGTRLSFRSACPEGQISTKMPRQVAPKIAEPEPDFLSKAIAIGQAKQGQAYLDRANAANNAIAIRSILVGMYANEVVRAWGRPDKVNATTNTSGKSEQWIYRRDNHYDRYVYLDNDVVRSFQTSD